MLASYKREEGLFTDKLQMPFAEDVFGGHEIIEEYDEEQEKLWRVEHGKRLKASKKLEALTGKDSTTEGQDIFERLEELELMEELEQEMESLDLPIENDEQLHELMYNEIKMNTKKRIAHVPANELISNCTDYASIANQTTSLEMNDGKDDETNEIETTDDECTSASEDSNSDVSLEFVKLLQATKSMNRQEKLLVFENKLKEIDDKLRHNSITVEEKLNICDLRYELEEALDFLVPFWESKDTIEQSEPLIKTKRKIKFADKNSVKIIECQDSNDSSSALTMNCKINHSLEMCKVSQTAEKNEIQSPLDIYSMFEHCFQKEDSVDPIKETKSILKNRDMVLAETHHLETPKLTRCNKQKDLFSVQIIGDVREHLEPLPASIPPVTGGSKKVSRFKQQKR
ncbi:uncharacterized protein LOC131437817 isoform X2 [Malaya genurostris]|nr:uncharacterized protein LOC131437817 isoform X2 [Malaya genurostris]XP_058463397.1 uncharacterized protein LOC131437817 isoform X2 [Malaya genurostris]XP_058463398.1 uncharacterized protein LOC131437817 isoform X2 [Malaya genurostris]